MSAISPYRTQSGESASPKSYLKKEKKGNRVFRDGTLPRITSSSRGAKRNIRIVKVADDDEIAKRRKLIYKLVWIGLPSDESENEAPEVESWSDGDDISIQVPEVKLPDQLPVENKEKAKDVESQTEVKTKNNTPENKQSTNRHKRYRPSYNQKNYNSSSARKFKASGRLRHNYDKSNANTSHNDERSYKYSNKDFGASNSFARSYNSNSGDINPWAELPTSMIMNAGLPFQYSVYPYRPVPVLDQSPPICTAESSIKPIGLLGDKPHPAHSHNYAQNMQNNNFIGNPNYWNNNNEYNGYSPNDYQRRTSRATARMSAPPHYKNRYQRKFRGNHKNRNNGWRKKGMDNSGHFDYRK